MSLYDNLRSALYTSTKIYIPNNDVIFSHQGGQEPNGTYLAINILKIDKIGMEDESTYASPDPNTTITSKNVYEATVRYMFVGQDSGNLAYDFEASIDNSAARFAFGGQNLAIMRKSEVRRVPEKRDTTYVDNFTLDVIFSYGTTNVQSIDIIENVDWTGNIIP